MLRTPDFIIDRLPVGNVEQAGYVESHFLTTGKWDDTTLLNDVRK